MASSSPSAYQNHSFVTQSQTSEHHHQQQTQYQQGLSPPAATPLRRPHVQAPPTLLTTSLLNNAHLNHGYGHGLGVSVAGSGTPLSATSLSSPFSPAQSQYSLSPSMAVRGPVQAYSAGPYNPQQWGRVNGGMGESVTIQRQTAQYAPRLRGPDEPMASPPPPYSPPPTSADSPSPAAVFSHGATPLSASTTFSPDSAGPSATERRWSPDSPYMQVGSPVVGQMAATTAFPPPPTSGQRVRSTSRNHAERVLDAFRSRNNHPPQSAIEPQPHQTIQVFEQVDSFPPNARRAVSASAVGSYPSRSPYASPVQQDTMQGIPPPPPGPPPTGSRSQSMNRVSEVTYSPHSLAPPRTRRPPGRGPALEPVPPTPANWEDQDPLTVQANWPREEVLHIDTSLEHGSEGATSSSGAESHNRRESSSLVRSPAVRNRSAKGLRERRSESQMGRRQNSGDSETSLNLARPLQDIVTNGDNSLASRRASARLTPKGQHFRGLDEALTSAGSGPLSSQFASGETTPQSAGFSPPIPAQQSARQSENLHRRVVSGQLGALSASNHSTSERPISHILHLPNEEVSIIPLSPESISTPRTANPDTSFTSRAMERHRLFLQKEAAAETDSERLHLFVEHMIAESRIRRERYADVFEQEQLDPSELMDGAFAEAEHATVDIHLAQLSATTSGQDSRPSSANSYIESQPDSASRQSSKGTSIDHLVLSIDTSVQDNRPRNFVPCLSPIASMSAVTRDETESRGRAPSRWWESGSQPSTNGDGFKVLERTKRETKYMSAVIENEMASPIIASSSHQPPIYGENEYPPEKTGISGRAESSSRNNESYDTPYTPDPRKLDVSRLITLPPPYPRRHPAVNNSHPDLADIRATVRMLNDPTETEEAHQIYKSQITEKRSRANSFQDKAQSAHDQSIQRRMDSGTISQSAFDSAEASLEATLATSRLELAKADFSLHESLVVSPLHTIYTTRISRATEALNALSSRLQSDTSTHSPNVPQEAGDEQPELLEKLTMLKWLFEARESLHRDLYTLLSERNDRYKTTVLLPLATAPEEERAAAEEFFSSDSLDRRRQYTSASLHRWTSFSHTIEQHITQGVSIILSAFWDIAPPLQSLLQRIPSSSRELAGRARGKKDAFQILIPRAEVEENPSYWTHPLRHLWSVVCHAEVSTRQFVEGQVSLWCLLQEIRESVLKAKEAGERSEPFEVDEEIDAAIRANVEDLKDKVTAVEGQWVEGLGGEIVRVKEGLRAYLEESGGWDDEMEDLDVVGSEQ